MKKFLISGILSSLLVGTLFASDDVVATVNGDDVTTAEVNAFLKPIAKGATIDVLPPQAQEKIIEQVIEKKLLAQNAIKEGITKDEDYKKALEKLKADLALEIWMGKQFENVKVTSKDAKEFYTKEKETKFKQEEMVKARHILLKTEDEAKDIIKELDKAKDVEAKFIELAKTKSTGPSGVNGGDLGMFGKKQMVPEFSEAAFSQKPKTVSKTPVKTQFGYHVIYVEKKEKEGYFPFEMVEKQIQDYLKMEQFKELTEGKAKKLRESAKVKITLPKAK
jgi:parvulin-like peptidyl-prolyl isomerase